MFNHYKPFDKNLKSVPDWRDTVYADIVERAFTILENRSEREIRYAIGIINNICKEFENRRLPGFEKLRKDEYSSSTTHVLRYEFDNYVDSNDIHFHNGSLAEYLAVLALAESREGFVDEVFVDGPNPHWEKLDHFTVDGTYFEDAELAIEWAERSHNGSDLPTDLLNNISGLAEARIRAERSVSRKKGYAAADYIKEKFADSWFDDQFADCKTRDLAAERFYETLTEDEIDALNLAENAKSSKKNRAKRLLLTALRKAIKSRNSD